jgi:hypothetical protein
MDTIDGLVEEKVFLIDNALGFQLVNGEVDSLVE